MRWHAFCQIRTSIEFHCYERLANDINADIKMRCAAKVLIDICSVCTLFRNIWIWIHHFWMKFSTNHGDCQPAKLHKVKPLNWIWMLIQTAIQREVSASIHPLIWNKWSLIFFVICFLFNRWIRSSDWWRLWCFIYDCRRGSNLFPYIIKSQLPNNRKHIFA